jgi:hypothetical protein
MTVMLLVLMPMVFSTLSASQQYRQNQYSLTRQALAQSVVVQLTSGLNQIGTTDFADYDQTGTIGTAVAQNNANLCQQIKVDTTGSTALERKAVLYLFDPQPTGDCTTLGTNWKQALPITDSLTRLAIDVGNTTSTPVTDSVGQLWQPDVAYDATTKIAGYHTTYPGAAGSDTVAPSDNITNVTSDSLYQTYRQGADLRYQIPVSNGSYIIELHMAELNETVDAGSNKRRMDVALEGVSKGTSVSPYEMMTAYNKAVAVRYTTAVTDGVLDLTITRSATSNNDPQLMGLVIYPKRS